MSVSVAVVILNYNGLHFLKMFLPQVVQLSAPNRVIVADNASTDNSQQFVEHTPDAYWLPLDKNHGFAEGYNQALKQIEAKYYILLNSDVQVTDNWLEPLVSFLEENPGVAACQPKVKSYTDPDYFEYAGASGGFLDYLGVPFCRGRLFNSLEIDRHQYDEPVQVFWATGACMAIRASSYWQVGGLDGRFFAHMEEIDLCWRLQTAGHTIWAVPTSEVYHVGGGTLPKDNPRKIFLNYRNGWWMLIKNLPAANLRRILPKRLIIDGLATMQWLLKGKPKFALAILQAHLEIWGSLRNLRSNVSQPKTFLNTLYPRSVIWQYFVKRCKTYDELPKAHGISPDSTRHNIYI